jgi:hypothetical protein
MKICLLISVFFAAISDSDQDGRGTDGILTSQNSTPPQRQL